MDVMIFYSGRMKAIWKEKQEKKHTIVDVLVNQPYLHLIWVSLDTGILKTTVREIEMKSSWIVVLRDLLLMTKGNECMSKYVDSVRERVSNLHTGHMLLARAREPRCRWLSLKFTHDSKWAMLNAVGSSRRVVKPSKKRATISLLLHKIN